MAWVSHSFVSFLAVRYNSLNLHRLQSALLEPPVFSVVRYEQPSSLVPNTDDTELHHLLRHDGVPLPARIVTYSPVAAADSPKGFVRSGLYWVRGVRAGDVDGMEE
jgi:hypothetical protein